MEYKKQKTFKNGTRNRLQIEPFRLMFCIKIQYNQHPTFIRLVIYVGPTKRVDSKLSARLLVSKGRGLQLEEYA